MAENDGERRGEQQRVLGLLVDGDSQEDENDRKPDPGKAE